MFPEALERLRPALRNGRDSLALDGQHKLFVYVCPQYVTPSGRQGWFIRPVRRELGGVTLLCTLKAGNTEIDRFYVYTPLFRKLHS